MLRFRRELVWICVCLTLFLLVMPGHGLLALVPDVLWIQLELLVAGAAPAVRQAAAVALPVGAPQYNRPPPNV